MKRKICSFLLAFLLLLALTPAARADGYVSGKLRLSRQTDRFTHRTETRRRIEPPKPSGGGGGSVGRTGGGGSGRSGHF